eukprot:CAMPEP_0117440698 /NCGR_PEP_ID=MMETSP0759-20121206/3232_1 /TAXON_ID=63605 /ORGANISM="Percolomonas cosmopolitus, Strain WS" /LENGTH=2333 /DNA_ID=CAMNT_0005232487 /DNA_START=386 /DNA_END=7387 /DNA_ORIENTATION=-
MTEKLNWIGIFFVTLVGYLCYFTVVVIESILSIFVSPKNGESSLPFFHTRFLPTDLKMEMNWDAIRVKDEHAAKAFITSAPVESTTTHVADSLPLEQFILILTPISLEMRSSLDCYARAIYTIKLEMTPSESRIAQSIQDARLASWFLSPSNLLRTSTRPKCLAPINALSAPQFKWLLSYSTASPHMYLFLSNQYCIEVFSLNEGKKICKWRHDELFGLKDGSGTAPDADSKLFVVQMQYVSGGHLILLLNDAQLYVVDVERMMSKAQSLNSNSNVESHLFLFDDMFHTDASVGCGKSKAKQCVLSFHVDVPGRTLYYVTVPKGTINEHVCPTTPASCAPILRAYKFPSTWFNKNVIPSLDNQFHPVISTPSAQFHSRRLIDATQMMTHNNSFLAHLSSHNNVLHIYDKNTLRHVSTLPFHDISSVKWYSEKEIILCRHSTNSISIHNIFTHEERLDPAEKFDGIPKVSQRDETGQFFILEQIFHGDSTIVAEEEANEFPLPQQLIYSLQSQLLNFFTNSVSEAMSGDNNKGSTPSSLNATPTLPKQYNFIYNAMSFQKESPVSYLEFHLKNDEYNEALKIAEAHCLEKDAVYKRQWSNVCQRHSTTTDALSIVSDWHISSILEQIEDKRWALAQSLNVLGDSDISMKHLLDLAMDLNTEILMEIAGIESMSENSDLQQDLEYHFDHKEILSDDESMLIQIRQHILRCADRLQTLLKYMKHYNWRDFQAFSCCDLLQYARENAQHCRLEFLEYLFVYHNEVSDMQRLDILSQIPLETNAKLFVELLPGIGSESSDVRWDVTSRSWRTKKDFVENMTRFQPQTSGSKSGAITSKMVSGWYLDRITALDAALQHENALSLTEIGLKKNISSLQIIHEELHMLCLISSENEESSRIRLKEVREMRGEQLLSQVLENAAEDNVVHRFQTIVLPYIAQRQKMDDKKSQYLLRYLLVDYLAIYRDEIRLSELVVRQSADALCGVIQEEPIVNNEQLLVDIIMACVYECPSTTFSDHKRVRRMSSKLSDLSSTTQGEPLKALKSHIRCALILFDQYSIDRPFRTFRQSPEEQKFTCQEILSGIMRFGLSQNFSVDDCSELWENLLNLHTLWPEFAKTIPKVELYEEFLRLCVRLGHSTYSAQRALDDKILSISQTSSLMFEVVEDMLRLVESTHSADPEHCSESREYKSLLSSITSLFNTYDAKIAGHPTHPDLQHMWQHEKQLFRGYVLICENFENYLTLREMRSHGANLELIHELLGMNRVTPDQFPILFEIASQLELERENPNYRDQILLFIGEKALIESDFDNALSVCATMMNDSFEGGWRICARLARGATDISSAQREKLLSFAISCCPSGHELASLIALHNDLSAQHFEEHHSDYAAVLTSFYSEDVPANTQPIASLSAFHPANSSDLPTRIRAAFHNQDLALFFSLLQQYQSHLEHANKPLNIIKDTLDSLIREAASQGTDVSLTILRLSAYFFAFSIDSDHQPLLNNATPSSILEYVQKIHDKFSDTEGKPEGWTILSHYVEQMKVLSHARQVEIQASELSSSLDVRRFLRDEDYRMECISEFAYSNDDSAKKLFESALNLASRNDIPHGDLLAAYVRAQFAPDNDSSVEQIHDKLSHVFTDQMWKTHAQFLHDEIQATMDDTIPGDQLILFEYALSLLIKIESLEPIVKQGNRSEELRSVVKQLLAVDAPIDFRSLFLLTTQEDILDCIRPFVTVQNEHQFIDIVQRLPVAVEEQSLHTMLFEKLMKKRDVNSSNMQEDLSSLFSRMTEAHLADEVSSSILDHSKMHWNTKQKLLEVVLCLLEEMENIDGSYSHKVRIHLFNARITHQIEQDEALHTFHDLWSDLLHNDSSQTEAALLDMIHSAGGILVSTFSKGLDIMSSNFDTLLRGIVPVDQVKHQKKIAETSVDQLVNSVIEVLLAYIDDLDSSILQSWSTEFTEADNNHPVPLIISAQWPPSTEDIGTHLKCLIHSIHESENLKGLEQDVHQQLRDFASSKDSSVEARLFVLNVLNCYASVKQTLEVEPLPSSPQNEESTLNHAEMANRSSTEDHHLMHQIKTEQYLEELFTNSQRSVDSSLGSLTPLSENWKSEFDCLLGTVSTPDQYTSLNKIISEWSEEKENHSALYECVTRMVHQLLDKKDLVPCGVVTIELHSELLSLADFTHYFEQLSKTHTLLACKVAMISDDETLQEECIKVLDNSRNAKRFLRESKNDETYGDLLSLCAKKGYASSIMENAEICKQLLQRRISMHTEKEMDFVASICCQSQASQDMLLLTFAAEYVSKCVYNVPRGMNTFSNALRLIREYMAQMCDDGGDSSEGPRARALQFLDEIL